MKKHFTSPKYFFMLWILLLASNPVQCNVSPVSIGFFNFKKVLFQKHLPRRKSKNTVSGLT
jgi:hypothetical protein